VEERETGGDAFAGRPELRLQALGNRGAAGPDGLTITPAPIDGINILIAARDAHGWPRLAGPTEPVLRTMQIVCLDEAVGCHSTVRHAFHA
jgi:stage II sporulation protein AA (anti-sigma F factor antagonist)